MKTALPALERTRHAPAATATRTADRPAHQAAAQAIERSPRMVAQRHGIAAAFGSSAPHEADAAPVAPNRTGLPDGLKAGVEALSGMDLADVRVHAGSSRPAEIGALAYAQGDDIHLAPGQERHLPHEAWHVVQQRQGRVQPTMQAKGVSINDDHRLEREADEMGAAALAHTARAPTQPKPAASSPANVAQRAGTEAVMWDDYHEAYDNLMSIKRNTNALVSNPWRNAFYQLEAMLNQAKAAGGGPAYNAVNVQLAHTQLAAIGLIPQPVGANPATLAARALVTAANARWHAFSGNAGLNRGAWAGSATHGAQPGDYVQTPAPVINAIRTNAIALGAWWLMASDSAPSGNALHRPRRDARGDFIYHL